MEKTCQRKLILYAAFSAAAFYILILPLTAGISVPLFCLLQCVFIPLLLAGRPEVKAKRGYFILAPFFLLSLNSFISASLLWRVTDFLCCMLLLGFMTMWVSGAFPAKSLSLEFLGRAIKFTVKPLCFLFLPFGWLLENSKGKSGVLKRSLIGVAVTLPCILILVVALASADSIFSMQTKGLLETVFRFLDSDEVYNLLFSIVAGLYLFGVVYTIFAPKSQTPAIERKQRSGDLLILNIPLISVDMVYLMFTIIQFRYLFAGEKASLPYGLSYASYARHGFFELVALSCVNIGLILLYTHFLHGKLYVTPSKAGAMTKGFLLFLCAATMVMLASSFYRMHLYNKAYGLTRLRIFVVGFLLFEAAGLICTCIYVLRPKFNIYLFYASLALCYYLVLNIVPIDRVVARHNVDRYFSEGKVDTDYLLTLSADAAPEIARLMTTDAEKTEQEVAKRYFENLAYLYSPKGDWRQTNLSVLHAQEIIKINGIRPEKHEFNMASRFE